VSRRAGQQFGRIRYDQIRATGVSGRTIGRWTRTAYLHPELPRVYAVGHPARSTESDLAAAALYAGPGAMLDGATALWWRGLLRYPPRQIFLSTPRRVQSIRNIVVHGRRRLERTWHRGLPITTPSQAILSFAATRPDLDLLRYVLANAEYHDLLDVQELQAISGQGIAGSTLLQDALQHHLPALARTRSGLEILLLTFCEAQGLPIPLINVQLHGWLLDAVWLPQKVVVEVDGWPGHRTPAQLRRDHQRDLEMRALGYVVLRYADVQLTPTSEATAADIRRHLARAG
jgi:hypothetical protein